jgi:hypothetical protein
MVVIFKELQRTPARFKSERPQVADRSRIEYFLHSMHVFRDEFSKGKGVDTRGHAGFESSDECPPFT